ncbi:MAG: hypothetical protein AAF420_02370 [Pseudomonadota bacterium]
MVQQISTIAWITCKEAVHGKLLWVSAASVLALIAVTELAEEVIITGVDALQAGIVAWGLRWLGVITLALFCVNSGLRELNDKVGDLYFAAPLRREAIYLGKLLGILVLSGCFAALAFFTALPYAPAAVALAWATSLWMELAIVTAFAQLVVISTSATVTSILLTLAFYLVARSVAALQAMANGPFFNPRSTFDNFTVIAVDALSWVMPPLHRFASADWLVTGVTDVGLALQLLSCLVYLFLLGSVTILETYRKQF